MHRDGKTIWALLAIAVCFLFNTPTVQADEFTDLVNGLTASGYSKKSKAIRALAATGDSRAVPALEALLAGDLYEIKENSSVVIVKSKGKSNVLIDPVTQAELGSAVNNQIEKIRINNRLRKVLRGVLGSMTLLSKDPGQRAAAADAVFKSRSPSMLEPLEKALAQEKDEGVRERMRRALAAVNLVSAQDVKVRLEAIEFLSAYSDPGVRGLFNSIALQTPAPGSPDAQVREVAATVLKDIEARAKLWSFVESAFQGISLGSVLLLAAIGLAITFGVMGVINMAHGEMVMLGAYTTYVVQEIFRTYAPGAFDSSLFVAIPMAFLVAGLVGIAIERGVIQFLYGRPLETLLATWGISLILQQTVRTIFGTTNKEVGTPSWMQGAITTAEGLTLTYNRIAIIVFAIIVLIVLMIVLRKTWFGLQMRAVTQNRPMASAMGIRTGWVDALTFGLGSGIAGIAGVALSQIDNVSPNLGQSYIIDSFLVVVFGGVGNLWGTLVGALSLGLVNKALEPYAGAVLGKIIVLVVVILFIQKKPRGLFPLKGRAAEN